jgi:hypothetical protein
MNRNRAFWEIFLRAPPRKESNEMTKPAAMRRPQNDPQSGKTGASRSALGMAQVLAWGDAITNELLEFFYFRKPPLIGTGPDTVIIDANLEYTSSARH